MASNERKLDLERHAKGHVCTTQEGDMSKLISVFVARRMTKNMTFPQRNSYPWSCGELNVEPSYEDPGLDLGVEQRILQGPPATAPPSPGVGHRCAGRRRPPRPAAFPQLGQASHGRVHTHVQHHLLAKFKNNSRWASLLRG